MALETNLRKTKKLVDAEILKTIPRKLDAKKLEEICGKPRYSFDLKAAEQSIHEPIWSLLERGGKRWRPALLLLIAEAFGTNPKKLMELSAIPEIVHNGTLMVDDVEDSSDLRRGKPAIHVIFGEDIAINAGNAMYFLPLKILQNNRHLLSDKTLLSAYEIYMQEMINLSYGQGFDILWHRSKLADISENDYLQMCAFKTGTLARMAAKLGALFGGASNAQMELAGEFAESIGIAFQIQDDILNLIGTQAYGKEIGGDISEGKRTLMVLRALGKLDPDKGKRLLQILNSHTKDSFYIREAITLITDTDAIDYSKEKARELVKSGWAKFSPSLKDSGAKKQLKEFADYLIERNV
ncbi:MAG: polyprenyl synthetase family protein [Candidatus Micrarchaeota archaeon]